MTPIASIEKPQQCELHVRQQFAISQHESNAEVIHILRQKTARMLAEKIMDDPRFYELKIEGAYGTLRTDIIVITVDEYFDLCRRKFKDGMEHAQGFIPKPRWDI